MDAHCKLLLKIALVLSRSYSKESVHILGSKRNTILPCYKVLLKRNSRREVLCKKDVVRNFAKFTGKHLCQGLFFKRLMSYKNIGRVVSCLSRLKNHEACLTFCLRWYFYAAIPAFERVI